MVMLALAAPMPAAAAQGDYRLGAQDKLRLKVYEWRATVNAVFEWTSLNAEFTVGASGSISLPMLGEIPAAGATTAEVARAVAAALRERAGLSETPDVAVEVVQYRPFYIVGAVNKPGEYPYRPELTVLQAMSIAGGLLGSGESGARLSREIIAGQGESQSAETEASALLARKARLEAELAHAEAIAFPPELTQRQADPAIATLMRQETGIFQSRRTALKTQIEALEQLKTFLSQGVASLQAQLKAQERERDLIRKELGNITDLVNRGLSSTPRQLELERAMSRMEGDRLKLEGELMKTRQDIGRADIAIVEARNTMANDVTAGLRETQGKLEQAVVKIATADRLLHAAQATYPRLLAAGRQDAKAQAVYRIVRREGGQVKETLVAEAAAMMPGDTLKVDLPLPEGLEPPAARRGASLSQ